jgi:hypothetical protein
MTIVQSLGVTTLVALMSADRLAVKSAETTTGPLAQDTVEAFEAYLRGWRGHSNSRQPGSSEPPPSYS